MSGKVPRHNRAIRRDIFYVQATFHAAGHINFPIEQFYAREDTQMPKVRTNLCEKINASQLARKIAASNRGRLRLKKARFAKTDYSPSTPSSQLQSLFQSLGCDENMSAEVYRNTIDYLNHVGCLDKIPLFLIRDYVIARCNCIQTLKKFVQSDIPVLAMDKKRLSPLLDAGIARFIC